MANEAYYNEVSELAELLGFKEIFRRPISFPGEEEVHFIQGGIRWVCEIRTSGQSSRLVAEIPNRGRMFVISTHILDRRELGSIFLQLRKFVQTIPGKQQGESEF